ncbi:metalloregulator ArsR/SmtB family transcription factor [Methanosphaera sp. ISO3-F5]|uniref:ArsR/SmtB family transcription factor n=1 Tax=Methanosphaera sp. ISO3-F5 TaxID=1452353 RepID=UPI002B260043|nr:metalloregulator ArsR/SmtB family transcription factor [Methanosphaera sp. ISO3-F5]WQH63991.1 metalloregulator ArsR/SmtB family transcription factor [Methanosphaera sp. ISO3-F5]
MKTENIISISKALSDKNRVEIIKLLSENELCACHLLEHFEITQPTLSHHMKQLTESGLVNVTKRGTWNHYSINKETIDEYTDFLQSTCKKNNQNGMCTCDSK